MTKLKFSSFLIVFLFCQLGIYAQPGWAYKIEGNLNKIDSTQIKKCIENKNSCYFGTIILDATTDLSRLNQLNATSHLSLDIRMSLLPKEFSKLNLSKVVKLSLSCTQLEDFSNFPIMNNLEILRLSGFQGDTLSIKKKLPNLKSLEILYANNLTHINNIINIDLEELSIRDCKKLRLNQISFSNLKALHFYNNQEIKLALSDLISFQKLEIVSLKQVHFESIPEGFPKSLKKISISDSRTNLIALNKLSALENMEELYLTNIELVWKKQQ